MPLNGSAIAVRVGRQRLHCYPDVGVTNHYGGASLNYIVLDPDRYFDGIGYSMRLQPGEQLSITLDKSNAGNQFDWAARNKEPRLSIRHEGCSLLFELAPGTKLIVTSVLPNDGLLSRLVARRRDALQQLERILGGPIETRPAGSALSVLNKVNAIGATASYRPLDVDGHPGSLVELPDHLTPIVIGDLHGRIDNLLKILCENGTMTELNRGNAALMFLGDAVHREDRKSLRSMESSAQVMDLILALKLAYPAQVFFLLGNHDCFSPDLLKGGVPQGLLWRQHLRETRGEAYCRAMQRFYDRSPVIAVSKDLVLCHAGPPRSRVSRHILINLKSFPHLKHQLVWNRLRSPACLHGYDRLDVRRFRKSLGLADEVVFIVAHSPFSGNDTTWLNIGRIARHHLVYSAKDDQVGVFLRVDEKIVPQVYTAERILGWSADRACTALRSHNSSPTMAAFIDTAACCEA
jgi:hypothetical protein